MCNVLISYIHHCTYTHCIVLQNALQCITIHYESIINTCNAIQCQYTQPHKLSAIRISNQCNHICNAMQYVHAITIQCNPIDVMQCNTIMHHAIHTYPIPSHIHITHPMHCNNIIQCKQYLSLQCIQIPNHPSNPTNPNLITLYNINIYPTIPTPYTYPIPSHTQSYPCNQSHLPHAKCNEMRMCNAMQRSTYAMQCNAMRIAYAMQCQYNAMHIC